MSDSKIADAKAKLSADDLKFLGDIEDKSHFTLLDILYENRDGGLHADMGYNQRKMQKFHSLVENTIMYENEVYQNNSVGQRNARNRRKQYLHAEKTWNERYLKFKNMFDYVKAVCDSK